MKHIRSKMQCCAASFFLMFAATCWAQDDAQAFIDNLPTHKGIHRAGDDVDVMDLSTISAKERKTTLEITNGRRIRIINGSFTRHSSLDGPIIHLANGSYLEIGDAAGVDAYSSSSRREAILMEGAELKVLNNGKLQGHRYTANDLNYDFMSNPFAAVLMTSDNDKFTTENGSQVYNTVDCEGQVDQGEHDVYIRPHATLWWRWLRWRGCGCQGKHIWVWGTLRIYRVWYEYYWRFIHVMPGGRVEIEDMNGDCEETVIHVEGGEVDYGGDNSHCTGGKYGWYCTGGKIWVRGGYLSGGTCGGWTGQNGISYHHGGTVHGGIHNYGIHYFYGGTCSGGGSYTIYNHSGGRFYYHGGTCTDGGKIWNEGDLYIDGGGSVNCGDIYCIRGGCIYILKKLTFTLRLIFTAENIVSGATVVVGGDGYKLTQEDISRLQISLPDGYEWKYDSSCGCITIHETTGISNSKIEDQSVVKSYNVSGRQTKENTKGLNIQMMNDGSVKKAIVK